MDTLPWNVVAGRLGSARLGFAFLYDVDSYRQSAENQTQVGELATLGSVRTGRLILDGTLGAGRRAWRYLAAFEPNRLENIDPPEITVKDLALSIPAGGNVWISIGRQKEGASQDINLGTRAQPYSERSAAVTQFLPTRNDGVRFWHGGPFTSQGRWGWSLGAFDSFLFNGNSFRANGGQYAARVFAAPIADTTGRVAQLALDIRVTGAQEGFVQFKTKPEVDAAPNFIDTGKIPASSATTLDVEALLQRGSVAFVGELLPTFVAHTPTGTVRFIGWYAGVSWRLQGAARTYDEDTGSLGRVELGKRPVVCELATRFTNADLTDESVDGGVLDRASVAATLYARHDLKLMVDYGFMTLSKGGIGRASSLTSRLQWELR